MPGSYVEVSRIDLASTAGRTTVMAASITEDNPTGRTSRCSFPDTIRDTSNRSSISWRLNSGVAFNRLQSLLKHRPHRLNSRAEYSPNPTLTLKASVAHVRGSPKTHP